MFAHALPRPTASHLTVTPVAAVGPELDACVRVWHAAFPYQDFDAARTGSLVDAGKLLLFVATSGEEIVGFATLGGLAGPSRMVRVVVHPDHRHQGVGSALLEELLALVPSGTPVRSGVPITDPRSVAFAERYGFDCGQDGPYDEVALAWRWRPCDDLEIPDVLPLGAYERRESLLPLIAAAADEIPYDDNLPRDDDDPHAFLASLDQRLSAVSVGEDGVQGITLVRAEDSSMHVLMTYVDPRVRGRGIARALKTHTLRVADPDTWVTTECRRNNTPILALNQSLGFEDVSLRIVTR